MLWPCRDASPEPEPHTPPPIPPGIAALPESLQQPTASCWQLFPLALRPPAYSRQENGMGNLI